MTPKQCRIARKLLGVSQSEVAKHLEASQAVISVFERTGYMTRPEEGELDRLAALTEWFERAGVVFTNGAQSGVKLRKADP